MVVEFEMQRRGVSTDPAGDGRKAVNAAMRAVELDADDAAHPPPSPVAQGF
jgi:hypothetical protein